MISPPNDSALLYDNGPNQRVGTGHACAQQRKAQRFFHQLHVRIGLRHNYSGVFVRDQIKLGRHGASPIKTSTTIPLVDMQTLYVQAKTGTKFSDLAAQ
jgi:hypothetical protein